MAARQIYEEFLRRKAREHGERWDASDLAPQFVEAFESGERIRVRFPEGLELTGTVGVTTGWRPVFLLMRRKNSTGSPWTLGHDTQIVRKAPK